MGFTLVEILVVVTIIGILLALVVPAVTRALTKSQQATDVSNAKQLGTILLAEAVENNGVYPTTDTANPPQPLTTSTQLCNTLIQKDLLTDAKVVTGRGSTPLSGNTIVAGNVAFGYVSGLTTSDNGRLPLLFTRDTTVTIAANTVTYGNIAANPWGGSGVAVFMVGNSAEFIKPAQVGDATIAIPLVGKPAPLTTTVLQP